MRIEENKELAPLTTFGVGGGGRWFVEAETEADVVDAAAWARARGAPLFVLGGGSNLLVADGGFQGLVLHVALKGIGPRDCQGESGEQLYEVAAGEDWDGFVQRTVEENCAGLECLAGIPGTVGGTPVQNVGAYGQEVARTITRVRAFDRHGSTMVELSAEECRFGYRRSRFNTVDRERYVIVGVEFRLRRGGAPSLEYADLQRAFPAGSNPTPAQVAQAVRRIRQSKGMLIVAGDPDCRSAGSFFKNPVVSREEAASVARVAGAEPPQFKTGNDSDLVKISAAWLIEKSSFAKGYVLGRAAISSKHTLALVNLGGATAAEIVGLAERIRSGVFDRFSIELQMEPVMLGF
ncbi:MAG: UDP-N-acetylmuramate dehydrogenase [Acidobacteriales bacterium]|nr:UDP-N-acetylmuramate dehydrogenase [Terriglobales bacterium]